MVIDINIFYLNTCPPIYINTWLSSSICSLAQEVINEYGLIELAHGDNICFKIQKGMYGPFPRRQVARSQPNQTNTWSVEERGMAIYIIHSS
jgi:hypothetical protein